MINIRNFTLGLALGLAATGAHAQTNDQTQEQRPIISVTREPLLQVGSDEDLAARQVLARELIDLSAGPNFAKELERTLSDQLTRIDDKGGEEAVWLRTNMPPMLTRMVGQLMDEMVPIYAELYSQAELRGQIDFYRSPVGRSVAAKVVPLGIAVQETQNTILLDFMTDLEGKYCARFDCDSVGQTSAKPDR